MTYPRTDIEIARSVKLRPIADVAARLDLGPDDLHLYGPYKAKLDPALDRGREGKLVLVTAINPTRAGEGKTTCTVGLGQALWHLGHRSVIALREPSLGPCMGVKGGATGGGWSQVLPMEDINLHFTGDLHAITAAHNLLAAMVDNALHHGTTDLDPRRVTWKRVQDVNDRALRHLVAGLGDRTDGVPRQTGFDITAASEVMAALCLATDLDDLRVRMGRFVVGFTAERKPVTAADLGAAGAMTALLRDAFRPNLVQTLEGTPAIIHGGPFANIAHGTNSVVATRMALRLADYVLTEAGFGADLGAEKFFDIVSRQAGFAPRAVVLVATVRALKLNGGANADDLATPDVAALERGLCNLDHHIELLQRFGVPTLVMLNRFSTDGDDEVAVLRAHCEAKGARFAEADVWAGGGEGAIDAARALVELADGGDGSFTPLYELDDSPEEKIRKVAQAAYGAADVAFTAQARRDLRQARALGMANAPVCIAKTPASLSDDPKRLGRPTGFTLTVREVVACAGAGFLVPITGDLMRMPGLPKRPAALNIDVDAKGQITGLA